MDRRIVVAAGVGLLLILLALPKACAFRNEVRVRNMAPELCVIPPARIEGKPYLKGRAAFVDLGEKKWDWLIGNYVPEEIRARRPDEVSSVVLLEWNTQVTGVYDVTKTRGNGQVVEQGKAFQTRKNCRIIIIDRTIAAVVGEQFIEGDTPSDQIRSSGRGSDDRLGQGFKPVEQVESYILGLPRR